MDTGPTDDISSSRLVSILDALVKRNESWTRQIRRIWTRFSRLLKFILKILKNANCRALSPLFNGLFESFLNIFLSLDFEC